MSEHAHSQPASYDEGLQPHDGEHHGPGWVDVWGTSLVIAVGVAYILICALWNPVSGS